VLPTSSNSTTRADFPTGVAERTRSAAQDNAQEDDSRKNAAVFPLLSLVTLTFDPKFELGRDFCTMHLTAKFHNPTFNHSDVIVLTNKPTNKQTDATENITSLRYATQVGDNYMWEPRAGTFHQKSGVEKG